MPVLPHCANPLQDQKTLYQFLLVCQQQSIEKNHPQLVSIALNIDPVDPLAALHELAKPDQPHFYLENRLRGEAIAALSSAKLLQTDGTQRFVSAQHFIHKYHPHFISNASINGAVSTPRFFCSFTFFDEPLEPCSVFPSATVFLPQWQIIRQQNQCISQTNLFIHSELNLESLTETIWHQFQTIRLAKYSLLDWPDRLRDHLSKWTITDTNDFQSAVAAVLSEIQQQHYDKLVLAHAVDVTSRFPFQPLQSLHHLRQRHPDCYVFSTSSGQGPSFIGASPERLISINDGLLITDALAGSAPRGKTLADDQTFAHRLFSSHKERHEHQVVVDFITERLAQLGLIPAFASTPGLLQLSNIQHLHTPIQAKVPADLHPLEIVAELHPTPAVAGLPRDIVCEQIHHHETFGRSLYAAPLGWVDGHGNAEFIVGIRSALISGHHARLYAGAGIVAGSQPERELAEVKLKLQALLQSLV
ncbi:isochorismate synthase [Oculatella sp. LEGE 06141]|uniref:isochorismate synthase n=1 Tax=Oculatella sp. LEGE 06141 TaxID=1828648 RepID=UPI00187F2C52|nr:isochorismate synthase [Oculatella sp. LEGE 06141]MBE9181896.1 isochorismate synthase [Oculatella sp. LEGE 06141]